MSVAILGGFIDVVNALLAAGSAVFSLDRDGGSPIGYAACCKQDSILKVILNKITGVNFNDFDEMTINEVDKKFDINTRVKIKHQMKSVSNQEVYNKCLYLFNPEWNDYSSFGCY